MIIIYSVFLALSVLNFTTSFFWTREGSSQKRDFVLGVIYAIVAVVLGMKIESKL